MASTVYIMRDGTIALGPTASAVEVQCQVTEAIISATPDPKEATTLCGKVTVPGITAFTLNLGYLQDWRANGISSFLFAHDGELVDFELIPTAGASPGATGKLYVSPGDFGGSAGEIMVGSVSLGLEGKPTITMDTVNPSPATGATAGTPGSWTPASSTPPATVADLIADTPNAVTASPATAWTAGQYVQTATAGSGGEANWNGTDWEAGRAS